EEGSGNAGPPPAWRTAPHQARALGPPMTAEPKRLTALFEDLPREWAWYGLRGICGLSVPVHRARAATIDYTRQRSPLRLCHVSSACGGSAPLARHRLVDLGHLRHSSCRPPRSATKPALSHAIRTQAG